MHWRFFWDWWPGLCVGRCFYYVVFCCLVCVATVSAVGVSSGTDRPDCVLEDVSKTMLFSVA